MTHGPAMRKRSPEPTVISPTLNVVVSGQFPAIVRNI